MDGMPELFRKWARDKKDDGIKTASDGKETSLRADAPENIFTKKELQNGAKKVKDGYFTVPKVIGKNDG